MVDYKKLYMDLYNKLTELMDTLEEIQEKSFDKFESSNPTQDDRLYFARNMDTGNGKDIRLR